jgi:methionyl-tRNA synthetase
VIERFGADALRFYCFRDVSFGRDGAVSAAGFEQRYEAELANDWGNLASRTLAMIDRYRDGVVPEAEVDPQLREGEDGLGEIDGRVRELLDDAEITAALEEIWARVRRLNRYVEESRPWDLAKDGGDADRLDGVLYNLAEGLRVLAILLLPYLPASSGRLLDALAEGGRELDAFGARGGGQTIERIPPLFPRIESA